MVKKVLITGGSGYIGSRLSLYLSNKGYAVTPLCYPAAPSDEAWSAKMDDIIVGDVTDHNFLLELSQKHFDVIIHLVSLDHRDSEGDPSFVASVNTIPVWNLLDRFSKKKLNKFIYFSTVQVYGRLSSEIITEQHKPEPLNAYGLTHLMGEQICEYYNRTSSVECRVIRLSNSYGSPVFFENNCWWLVVNDLCKQAFYEKAITLNSDGTPLRDFIHGWDVCQAVEKIIATNEAGFLYQVSSANTLTILEIAKCVQRVYKNRYGEDILINKAVDTSGEVTHRYLISNDLLRNIGFESQWSIEQGVGELFDYLERYDGK